MYIPFWPFYIKDTEVLDGHFANCGAPWWQVNEVRKMYVQDLVVNVMVLQHWYNCVHLLAWIVIIEL